MIFPFSIKYTSPLGANYDPKRQREALEYIGQFMTDRSADEVDIEHGCLIYRVKLFGNVSYSTHILVPSEKGVFFISQKDDKYVLTYHFFMYRLFTIVSIMSLFFAAATKDAGSGILAFLWLGGMNWILAAIRHNMMLSKIVGEIDHLMSEPGDIEQIED